MSLNSFLGFVFAIGLFVGAIVLSTDNYAIFVNLGGLAIVIGGTLAATFLGQEARYVLLALRGIVSIFGVHRAGRNILNQEVGRIIKWGYLAQQKGVVALEAEAKKVRDDPFLAFAVEQLLTDYSGEEIRENLRLVADTTFERNMVPANILRNMGATAPAFGMIGTLIGLVIMLDDMGEDPTQLGKGLAVALTTTLYGVMMARLMLVPAANKLTQRNEILRFRHDLIAEGISMLADRRNPRYIQDRMNSFLDPAIRFDLDRQMKR